MKKYPLIGISIVAVVLLVLGSFNNIVGYQTVQASNQKIITTELNEKELLFQTIVDMVNNKDIQRVILGSELTSKKFFDSGMKFSTFKVPVITERFLKHIYTVGELLFRTLSKSKIQSFIEQHHQIMDQRIQKEISGTVEKNAIRTGELTQLSNLKCDCEKENTTLLWPFPVICQMTKILFLLVTETCLNPSIQEHETIFIILILLDFVIISTAVILQCSWVPPYMP